MRSDIRPHTHLRYRNRQQGFSYLIALFMVALLAILTLRALGNSVTKERRDHEAELLYVGQAYRKAIQDYYENSPGTARQYPQKLDVLIQDDRTTTLRRHLRKLYRDPITGSSTWGMVMAPEGGIQGVYSLSPQQPIKVAGFPAALFSFTGAKHYTDWQFTYLHQ